MHNPVGFLVRSTMRVVRTSAVVVAVPSGLLVLGAGVASAQEAAATTVHAEPAAVTFGLLGPVGLVAIALGLVGMTAGVFRQRRKTRAAVVTAEPAVSAMAGAGLVEQPTRPARTPSPRRP